MKNPSVENQNEDAVQDALNRLARIIIAMYLLEHPLPNGTGTLPFLYHDDLDEVVEK